MAAYFTRRLLLMIPTFLGVTLLAFTLTRFVPGGPIEREIMRIRMAGAMGAEGGGGGAGINDPTAALSEDAINALKKTFNFDKPIHIAYLVWLRDILMLDLGVSFNKREPVWDLIRQRLPVSVSFGLTGFALAYLISIPLGILKALHHGSTFDLTSSVAVFVGYSIPGWALGALLLVFLASGRFYDVFPLGDIRTSTYDDLPTLVRAIDSDPDLVSDDFGQFQWERLSLPSKILDRAWHMTLPVLCYMMSMFASLTILTKNSLMDNLGQDYVRTAFAKGLAPTRVVLLHALRNSLIPLATGLGHAISYVMAGSYLIEWVFNIDGIGYLGYTSIVSRDYTVVMGVLAINTVLILLGNILSDVLYALIDPRIRFE